MHSRGEQIVLLGRAGLCIQDSKQVAVEAAVTDIPYCTKV